MARHGAMVFTHVGARGTVTTQEGAETSAVSAQPSAMRGDGLPRESLFDFDSGALFFQRLLDLGGFVLRRGFLDDLRSAFDQIFGLFEP